MLKPLADRVILKVQEEESVGGIVLASAAQDKPQMAQVLAVGEGIRTLNGDLVKPSVKVGDNVFFEKFAGTTVKFEGEEYLLVREADILAIVE